LEPDTRRDYERRRFTEDTLRHLYHSVRVVHDWLDTFDTRL
jgi:hypothetical protein